MCGPRFSRWPSRGTTWALPAPRPASAPSRASACTCGTTRTPVCHMHAHTCTYMCMHMYMCMWHHEDAGAPYACTCMHIHVHAHVHVHVAPRGRRCAIYHIRRIYAYAISAYAIYTCYVHLPCISVLVSAQVYRTTRGGLSWRTACRLQPLLHTVAASATYGCSLCYIRLQPLLHTVAASATYGCSLCYIRLQPLLHTADRAGVQAP